jgi:hypothetical protein
LIEKVRVYVKNGPQKARGMLKKFPENALKKPGGDLKKSRLKCEECVNFS